METTEITPAAPPKKRRSCCLILAIAPLILLGIAALLWCMPAPRLVISEETTRITGPLTADGQIDFFKALELEMYPPELATDDNGFRHFVRTFGNVGEASTLSDPEFYRLQKYEKLGLDPDVPPTLVFPKYPLDVFRDYYKESEKEKPSDKQLRAILERPWTLEEFPMLADWIAEIDEPMDAIAVMIHKPIFMPPMYHNSAYAETGKFGSLTFILLPDVQFFREIARMYQARAMYRIAQDNIDGAIDDKLTLHRLGRLVAQKGCLVQVLVGLAIEGMAAALPVGANPEHPLTEPQIRRILEGLNALPPRVTLDDAFQWERYIGLSMLQEFANGGMTLGDFMSMVSTLSSLASTLSPSPTTATAGFASACCPPEVDWFTFVNWLVNKCSMDYNVAYRRLNEAYDVLRDEPTQVDDFASQVQMDVSSVKSLYRMWTPAGRGGMLADMLITLLLPATSACCEAVRRAECADNFQRLALAILLYEHEHGKMPDENWAEQIGVPATYFSCPSNLSPQGMTTYALVQYGNTTADTVGGSRDTLMLIELKEAVPLDKAVITVDDVIKMFQEETNRENRISNMPHPGGMNTAYRGGGVQFLSGRTESAKLLRLLGREEESNNE